MRKLLLLTALSFSTIINAQTITVSSPNGAEVWAGCTIRAINWSSVGTSGFFSVDYSTNGGTTWTSLATNLAATTYSWTVPNTSSTNCLVRVFDFNTPATVDQSNGTFTITAPLILTSPNGGESWQVGGPTQNITWVATGTGANLTIEYSINAGTSWIAITTVAVASSGSYTWTIPNNPSAQCLVRIRDVATPCMTDVSNNLFTIAPGTPTITVTAPNTAVTYYALQSYNITWTSAYLINPNVMIEYSINNGTSWITIVASVANSGTYNWLVPNNPSALCLVRVSEFSNPSANDVSNVNFTISPPVITVTAPNTALTYYVANTYNITWTNTTLSGLNVRIEYSIDNGTTWISIIASVSNTGSYSWLVPNNPSITCLVRVSDASNLATFDVSNVNFTIAAQFITVTSPNGGENWAGCSSQTITWNRGGTINNARIEYSLNGGSTWTTIIASYNAGAGTSCSYIWAVIPNTPSTNCNIRVTDISVPTATDVSNAPFTISQNTAIIVNTPNGGEVWQVGGPAQNITWAAVGTSANLYIQYSIDNGTTWIIITTTAVASSGLYVWTIPNTPSTNCLVQIYDPLNICKFDNSNAVFTISPPTPVITVTSPNSALTYYVANSYNITWTSAYLTSSFVRIEYSIDNGSTWIMIVASVANNGFYGWLVPNTPSITCLVRVSEFGTPAVNDVSNVNFIIAPQFITVTSPNGGENLAGCSSQPITWNRGGTLNNARIEYSLNGGVTWITIIASFNAGIGNICGYNWLVVPNTPSTNCLIRVTDVSIPTATDISNAPFTILLNTSIIVTAPNGGEVWQVAGPTQNITWAAAGTSANLYILYSIDNGNTWITITTTAVASSGLYVWTIPNNPSTTCLVQIYDPSNICKFDISNAVFTISPPTPVITVTAPNTALTYYVANSYNITWTSVYLTSSFVRLEYSIDNGATWIMIVASVANNGSYGWLVPNTPSSTCLVRVSEFGTPAVNDVSNVNFIIAPQFITVISPNGGENWAGCSAQAITWNRGGTINNARIEYSLNGGSTWTTIIASYNAGTGTFCSYTWTVVPNTPSSNCLFRVTDISITTATDVSNAPFTISPNTSIIVTAPNGGEVWQVGGPTQNITWAAVGTSANLTIQYSIDNGISWITITTTAVASSGLYVWTIPNNPSTTCLVRILDASNTCKFDNSDANFTIQPGTPIITVTAPNTAVTYYALQNYNITWTSVYLINPNVMIEYSINNGVSWITIVASVPNTGTYNWLVPNTPSTVCLVRVSEFSNPAANDVSNVNFIISSPVITVTAPNSALTYYVANNYTITWTNTTLSGPNVRIEYSIDNGTSWIIIVSAVSNTGTYSWLVPNTPSTTCLVKVSDAATLAIFDVSNVNFTIAAQFITVTSPNGGENWAGCSSQTITWNRGGTINNARIEYSLDGGTTWIIILSSYNAGAGTSCSYNWATVPNTPSTTCFIRVTDVNVSTATDVSNFQFTILQNTAIVVNTPNGGEVWQVGGPTQNITWAAAGTSANLTIQYSIDNGTTWITITTTVVASSGLYVWTIPNTPSTTCLVRVIDASNTCRFDISNAVFTISPPTPVITVTSPNSALTYYVANSYNITWTSAYLTSSFVRIEYSIDNGSTWIMIVASVANNGSYGWLVPNTPSSTCLVRVSEFGTPAVNDVSNVNFIIAPQFITVTSPNGGENLTGCSSQPITWNRGGTLNNARIEYSLNGGVTWTTIVASYNAGIGNICGYNWTVVPNTPSTNCLIRVTDVSIPTATDVSNFPFTIALNTSIIVTSPNGGEVWQVAGPTQNITWAAVGTSANLGIQYSIDNGNTWITITTTAVASSGLYVWTIPNTPSTTCLVQIYDPSNTCRFDISNAVFTISPPTPVITVTSPNIALTYYVASTYNITWTSAFLSSTFVIIEYSINNGGTWIVISAASNNTGTYSWLIPNTPSTQCLVKVSDWGTPATFDISNTNFTIAPAIIVTAPNGGENLGNCTATSINWTAGGCSGSYRLEYSINGGSSWIIILASFTAPGTGLCSYAWTLPSTPSTNCLVRVTDVNAATKTDQSNAIFTISPAITVTQPNVGGSFIVGSILNINWTSSGVSNFYNIDYSIDNGVNWINVVFNVNIVTNTYAWTIPNNPSVNCLVRVTDNINTCKKDQSDVVFTITSTAVTITVTAPDGGENWQTCSTQNITWNATGTSGSFNIDYSTNGGSTWTSIITSYAAPTTGAGSYSWTLPNTISANALIKVTDAVVTTRVDQSNSAFTMSGLPLTASGTAAICNGLSTPLTASGTTSYSWLPATGLSSTTISNPTANPTTTTTYTVTGTTGGCSNTATVTVTVNPVPTVSVSPASTSVCTGGSTTLMASGGTTYSWLPTTGLSSITASTVTATPATTTTYTVTGTTTGCAASATAAITVSPIPTITTTGSSTICVGSSASLSASGGTTYSWSPGTGLSSTTVSNPTASPTTSITYTVSGTTLGCTGTATVLVTVTPLPNVTTSGNVNICLGASATITASGATSYSWLPTTGLSNPNIANPSASPTATTTYTVTGTAAGCTNTTTVIVTVNPIPSISVTGITTICAGGSTTLTASGATTYSWSPSAGLSNPSIVNPSASPTATTTYTITGTTAGCTNTTTVIVTVSPVPSVSATGTATICAGGSTPLTASGATTYSWSPSTGLSSTTSATPTASPTTTTTYTVVGTTSGCSASATITITVTPIPVVSVSGTTTICNGSSTSLLASGATTYNWLPSTGLSSSTIANPTANPTATTTYTVTGSTGSCTGSITVTITVNPIPSVNATGTATICAGASTSLNSSGAVSYAWLPVTGLSNANIANPIATPTATTTYTVTGTSSGCSNTASATVTITPLPVITVSGATSICSGGSTVITASGGTTYSWSPATGLSSSTVANPTASPATTTTYTVSGTVGSCTGTATVTITVNTVPVISVSGTTTICDGASTTLTASGATSYSWLPAIGLSNPSIANPIANPSTTTTYTVSGTTGGCTGTTTLTIAVNSSPVTTAGGIATICSGVSTGLTSGGATTYSWSPITGLSSPTAQNPTATPAATTTYTVTGTSAGCSSTATVTVTVNPTPIVSVSGTTTICNGSSTVITASGATSYTWLPATGLSSTTVANPTANPTTTTTYTVSGTTGSCTGTTTVTITVNPIPVVSASGTATICVGLSTPLTASGGTTYSWLPTTGLSSSTVANPTATPATTTTYTVTGTTLGCSATATVTVTVNPTPIVSVSGTTTICNGSSTVITASGATSYTWLPATGLSSTTVANPTANPNTTTTYTVSGTTGSCTGTTTVTITVNLIPVSASGTATICVGLSTPLTASGGTTYSWLPTTGLSSSTVANPIATPATTTTYTVTGTTLGCSATATVTITVNPAPVANAGAPGSICSGGSYTLNASGGTTYSWLPASGLSSTIIANPIASPITTTTYTVTVSNGGTCNSTATVTITVTPSPTANAGSDVTIACGASTTLNASGGTSYSWSPSAGLSSTTIANPVATPIATTTYTVTVSNGTCTATDAVTVTAGSMTANAGPDVTICSPSSTTLSGSSTGGGGAYVNIATSYTYSQNVATYTAITGGTVWLNGASPSMDDLVSASIAMPTFNYNNINYTAIYISSNGFITFGATAPTTTNYNPIGSSETYAGAIAGFGTDINKATAGTPEIRYQTIGTEFIVQFRDVGRYDGGGTLDRVSFQIRLNTVGNTVKVVYAAPALVGAATVDPEVGLRGPNNTFATNVHNRLVLSSTGPWVNSTQGTTNLSACFIDSSVPATVPASGTTFTWTLSTGGTTTYAWSPTTGLSSSTIANPIASPTTTTTYTLTATNGACAAVDQVTVTVVNAAGTSAGSDAAICSGANTTLAATGGGTYSWSPSTGLSSTTIANPIASPMVTTTYTVSVSSGSCTYTDAVVITVTPTPTANAGSDVSICTGSSTTLSASGGTSYSWLPATGLSSTTIANPIANPATTSTYTVTVTNGSCTATDIVVVTVNPPPIANAGSDVVICSGASISLTASGGTTYSWLPATGLSSTTIANPIANPISTTSYTVTVSNGTCTATDVIVVTVNTVIADAGTAVAICSGGNTTLAATGGTSYTWIPATGLSSTTIANPIANPTSTTTYTVIVTDGACSATDLVTVTVNTAPVAPVSISGSTVVCEGSSQTNSVAFDPDITSYSWILPSGWTGFSSTNSITVTIGTNSGVLLVTASNACGSASPVTLNVTVDPLPTVTVSSFGITCIGTAPFVLSGGSPAGGTYSGTGVTGGTTFNPSVSGSGIFSITYTYSDGTCSNMASDNIQVDLCTGVTGTTGTNEVKVYPNPFNDFTILSIGKGIQLKGTKIHIFDMTGKEVMIITDITTYELRIDSKDMQNGMYFFQLMNRDTEVGKGKLIIQ